jgi:hypothetical protein
MKKIKIYRNGLLIIGLALILLAGTFAMSKSFAEDITLSAVSLTEKPFTSKKLGISIQQPKGWTIDESGKYGAELFFFNNAVDKVSGKSFTANINLTTEGTQGYSLKSYVDASKKYIKKSFPGYKSLPDRNVTVNGKPGVIIGGTFTQQGYKIRNEQLITISGDKAYIVTATALASTWTKYSALFDASLLTLKVVK